MAEELFKSFTVFLAAGAEACAGIVIALAIAEATFSSIVVFAQRDSPQTAKEDIRLRMGRWLALGLEFELAADILRTTVTPTWNEIGQLAAIVVLRTTLNYFLQREIDLAEQRKLPKAGRQAL